MNIFVLDNDPDIAAQMMCDKHVVKMIVETAQILCTVVASFGYDTPYRPTHKNHPCTAWAGKNRANWGWLIDHGMALCDEYTERYGKIHKSQSVIEWCAMKHIDLPSGSMTPFAICMPTKYIRQTAVESYREYYVGEKSSFAKWKLGSPSWWRAPVCSNG